MEVHFGLGKHTRVDITVTLLNKRKLKFNDIEVDRFLDLNLAQGRIMTVVTTSE